jgi:hypothetical protein
MQEQFPQHRRASSTETIADGVDFDVFTDQ